jgi:hypothetical protein
LGLPVFAYWPPQELAFLIGGIARNMLAAGPAPKVEPLQSLPLPARQQQL